MSTTKRSPTVGMPSRSEEAQQQAGNLVLINRHSASGLYGLILFFFLSLFASFSAWAQEPVPDSSAAYYDNLADMLEDDAARQRLIEELRFLASGQPVPEAAPSGQPVEDITLARRLANTTQAIAQNVVGEFTQGALALRELAREGPALTTAELTTNAINLSLVILATVFGFLVLRRLARPGFAMANRWAMSETRGSRMLRKFMAVLASALLDLLVITLAYVGGYLLALSAIGEPGVMDTSESLFLNAFLLVEVFKAVLRGLFASNDRGLRMLPMSSEQAAYWNAWLARLAGFIGYGNLVVVPIVNFYISPAVGRLTALLIMTMAFLYALMIILQNRRQLTERLETRARQSQVAFFQLLLSMLAKSWHAIAIFYFAALAALTVVRPEDALPFMLRASVQTLLAVGIGLLISVVLTQIIGRGFKVKAETRRRFPQLEERLNSFIPTILKIARLLILFVVLAFIADAWALFNLPAWLASEVGTRTVGTVVSVAIIVTLALAVWIAVASWIEQRLNPETGNGEPSAREKTLLAIFRNALAVTLVIMTAMIVLAEIGINIGPLIAGAGVVGLAIGFGAQSLVQDVITGIFIQLENAINTGDIVTAAGVTGTAERLTIRSLGIRDLSGTYHMIPFSSVETVSNYMRDYGYHVGEYGVAYREDIDEVIVRLREAFAELISDPEQKINILDELEVHGVTALADSSVNIRVRIKTIPGTQWAVGRAYNRLVKYHLDAAGIEIPFPHMTMYFGQNKDGTAPPAPVTVQPREPKREQAMPLTDERAETNAKQGEDFDEKE